MSIDIAPSTVGPSSVGTLQIERREAVSTESAKERERRVAREALVLGGVSSEIYRSVETMGATAEAAANV